MSGKQETIGLLIMAAPTLFQCLIKKPTGQVVE